jgi:hypothetical protein
VRIRSIKPEFWRSRSISALGLDERLLFIGLWSYVDDNGVGRDRLSNVVADLFADDVERDPRETFARVSRGLAKLSEAGRITRYTVDGHDYLSITNWDEHQRIDKPARARYPLPTTENATPRESVARPSRDPRETLAPGTGEQRNRGTGEQGERVASQAKRAHKLPADWMPKPETVTAIRAELPNVDLSTEHRKFSDHFAASGKPMKDWDAAWRNWMRRAPQYAPRPGRQDERQAMFDRWEARTSATIEGAIA